MAGFVGLWIAPIYLSVPATLLQGGLALSGACITGAVIGYLVQRRPARDRVWPVRRP